MSQIWWPHDQHKLFYVKFHGIWLFAKKILDILEFFYNRTVHRRDFCAISKWQFNWNQPKKLLSRQMTGFELKRSAFSIWRWNSLCHGMNCLIRKMISLNLIPLLWKLNCQHLSQRVIYRTKDAQLVHKPKQNTLNWNAAFITKRLRIKKSRLQHVATCFVLHQNCC